MDTTKAKFKAYLHRFLPRDVVGPVLIVFSLEGVIDGLFTRYIADGYATLGWAIIFLGSLFLVAYWGAVDEPALDELNERLEEIEESQQVEE